MIAYSDAQIKSTSSIVFLRLSVEKATSCVFVFGLLSQSLSDVGTEDHWQENSKLWPSQTIVARAQKACNTLMNREGTTVHQQSSEHKSADDVKMTQASTYAHAHKEMMHTTQRSCCQSTETSFHSEPIRKFLWQHISIVS